MAAMRQLSGHGAGFLYTDSANANANVSLLHIHDQSTAPGGVVRFKQILSHLSGRLHRAPLFRQRLQRVPLGLDHPYWVDDEHFDLEYHVRHIALPKPGDWRQFCIQVSRIHARPLDLDRPLWEAYVIEGLDSFLDLPEGSFALLFKTHLAAVDLDGLGALTAMLYDDDALAPPPAPPEPWFADSAPGQLALVGRGLLNSATSPWRLARPLAKAATHLAPAALALASEMLVRPQHLPPTRFNAIVSPHRVFETRRFTEAEFDEVLRLVPGASVEDVVAAVCGGALRQYLDAEGELPESGSLTAIVPEPHPAPTGDEPQAEGLAWRHVLLRTDIADPLQRLRAIRKQAGRAPDAVARVLGSPALADATNQAQAALLAWSRRTLGRANARVGRRTPAAHCTITHVPAPTQALFLCGARLTYYSAILPISDGLGLGFAVTRFDGRVVISPTCCREQMPDPEVFAQALRDSFQALLALARAAPRPARQPRRAPAVKSARQGGSSAGKPRRAGPRA